MVHCGRDVKNAGFGARIVRDGLAEEVARLRAQPGTRHVLFGGPKIAETFISNDFVDELRISVHPVLLGGGTPFFPGLTARRDVELTSAVTFDSGVVALNYRFTQPRG
jgi:dihydrofolate reductase